MNSIVARRPRSNYSKLDQVGDQVGNTPLLAFPFLSNGRTKVYAKAEWMQISGSVKARAAYGIIKDAVDQGQLSSGKHLLDASSGNTAIAYGAICKQLGIEATICLPQNASSRRIEMLNDLGVEIVFTSPFEGTEGAQAKARELYATNPDKYYYADQYSNDANWQAHYNNTGVEILHQTGGELTHFVAGLGTTGTFVGTTRRLKENADVECIALQPDTALHIMEGWKHLETADVPSIYDNKAADGSLEITADETIAMMQLVDRHKGIRISPSSAANLVGAQKAAKQLDKGLVVTILPDAIDRYAELENQVFNA